MLGMTWMPGLFGDDGDSEVEHRIIQMIFDIFTGLQGFFIFLLFVVLQDDARKALFCFNCCTKDVLADVTSMNHKQNTTKYEKSNSVIKIRKRFRRVTPENPHHKFIHVTNGHISKTTFV